jgi:hypothetical protein
MVRDVAILGAALVAFQVACPQAFGAPAVKASVVKATLVKVEDNHARHTAIAAARGAAAAKVAPHVASASHAAITAHVSTAPHISSVPRSTSASNVLAALRAAAANKKIVRREVAHAAAVPASAETAMQFPAPAVDTADGVPTSLAFHAVPTLVTPHSDFDPPAKSAHSRLETTSADPAGEIPVLPSTPPVLTNQENEASQIAGSLGDTTFLMIDKARGRIILFEDGQPVFAGPALTGQSTADEMPKNELTEKFDNLNAPSTKITPAGRYSVQRGFDPEVGGPLFDVHEIRGKDWGIAIHQLYLGIPSEHRDVRILSSSPEDKHITYGCINIQTASMQVLLHELPEKRMIPLYILPQDASQTAAYLLPRTSS